MSTTLREYLTINQETFRAFAARVDMDPAQLNRYISGKQMPSLKNAYKIYKATKKKVGFEGWMLNVKNK